MEKSFNPKWKHTLAILLTVCSFACFQLGCNKETGQPTPGSTFVIESDSVPSDSLLPVGYTCDGAGISPPLHWSGFPGSTRIFALLMDHLASPTDIHWYWVVYNIPVSTCRIGEGASGFGVFGTNSINGRLEYAPPCSQGPGRKEYRITVYALADSVRPPVSPENVTRQILLDAIRDIMIDSATLTVWYARSGVNEICY